MTHDRRPGRSRVLERMPHERGVHDRMPVVRERDRAGGVEREHLGELSAFLPQRDRRDRVHAARGRRGAPDDPFDPCDRVEHRARVRHAGDRREAAGRRGERAGLDRLLRGLAGLAEVDVEIDEPGRRDRAARVDHRRRAEVVGCDDPAVGEGELDPLTGAPVARVADAQALLVGRTCGRRLLRPRLRRRRLVRRGREQVAGLSRIARRAARSAQRRAHAARPSAIERAACAQRASTAHRTATPFST